MLRNFKTTEEINPIIFQNNQNNPLIKFDSEIKHRILEINIGL